MRECVNCKHNKGLGSNVWCGHEPKGKESYMMETDCPYYENVLKEELSEMMKDIMSAKSFSYGEALQIALVCSLKNIRPKSDEFYEFIKKTKTAWEKP